MPTFVSSPSSPTTVFLVGMRASGKTTLGRALADRLGYAFTDTDELVVRTSGRDVASLVAVEGWEGFRNRESLALRAAAAPFTVVATGGGVVLGEANRLFLRHSGLCVYLAAGPAVLAERLRRNPCLGQRPALTGAGAGTSSAAWNPAQEVEAVLNQRESLYREAAHHVVRADRPAPDVLAALTSLAALPLGGEERAQ